MNDLMSLAADSSMTMLEKVCRLETKLLDMPQADIKTIHTFRPGIYERTIVIPPWTVLTGAEHRTPYRVRLDQGTISVNTDEGVKMLTAPCEFSAPAGVKRVGRVFEEEVIWTDIYPNEDDCLDLAVIEARLYVIPEIGLGENRMRIEKQREDFALFLDQMGMTAEQMSVIVQIEHDMIPMPEGFDVEVRESPIHGQGLFAARAFKAGETICPGRINGQRTPAGRFTNHSNEPNATTVKTGDDLGAVAIRPIKSNEEILIDYRTSMRVNFGIAIQGESSCQVG
jgi:hypothetical protein